ncbi:MAG: aminopeptidase [Gemmatimonadota bacterium]|nr:aminopeptidase [Gemmatimonadota bacterium]
MRRHPFVPPRPRPGLARRAVLALLGAASAAACSPEYVVRAGWEEAKILARRQPIDEILADSAADPELRAKLSLVRDARVFAERRLNLDAGSSFTSYAPLDSDTLVLVVSAAPELALRWKTWWFPIVGHLPYKGYFDFDRARREAASLRAEGWDVYVRPSAAFSTLGWLPDPVLPPSLRQDSVELVETVVHEITHTTFFPKGQARFNESFANFVGWRGAIEYFCEGVGEPAQCRRATDRWHDVRVFGRFFHSIVDPLEALYASDLPEARKRERKREILDDAARRWREELGPELRSGRYAALDPETLNNAWLLSRVLYYTRLDDFERLYETAGGLRHAVRALVDEAGDGDPWQALDRLLAGAPPPRAPADGGR